MCLQGAIQAAVKPADCGLIVQNNTSSHKMHPIIVNLIPKEATSSLPLLMRSTLCSSSRLRCLWMLRSLCCAPQPPLNTRPSISARPASVIERRRIPEKEDLAAVCVCMRDYERMMRGNPDSHLRILTIPIRSRSKCACIAKHCPPLHSSSSRHQVAR